MVRAMLPVIVIQIQGEMRLRKLTIRLGPLSSVTVMGQTIIIINDRNLAFELLEKRSAIHSSRPSTVFADEM
jgi:hypothetical protein